MLRRLALAGALLLAGCDAGPSGAYRLDLSFGEPGTAPGQFREPTGIALNATEIFVADARNARIQVFAHDGTFRRQFGQGKLQRPMNLALAGGELFVPDYFADAIYVFGLDGVLRATVRPQQGRLSSPGGVAVRRDGSLLVADTYAHRIVQLARDGTLLRVWGSTGETGIRAARFNYPTDVAVTPDDGFVVADGYNDRLQAFAPDGRFRRKRGGPFGWNVSGRRPGWFATASGVAVDAAGAIYAADFHNNRIQVFGDAGRLLALWPVAGPEDPPGPVGVAVAGPGAVFVANTARNRVERWTPAPTKR